MQEHWRDIPGYESFYQVSDCGRVRSLPHMSMRRNGAKYCVQGRILKPFKHNKSGHLAVMLCKDGGRKIVFVHRLVMLTFVGHAQDQIDIRHLNSDPKDNHLSNLAYGTRSENMIDASKLGHICNQKLSPYNVLEIRERLANKENRRIIAKHFGIAVSTVGNIASGHIYSWL